EKRGERDERTIDALAALGSEQFQASQFPEAVATAERALALSTAVRGERNAATIQIMRDLGIFQTSIDGYGAALPLFLKAAELRTAVLGPTNPQTLSVINDVGNAYLFTGDYAKALETYERIVKLRLEAGSELDALDSMRQLAIMYDQLGRTGEAVPIYEKIYRAHIAKEGEASAGAMFSLTDVAGAYAREGKRDEALGLLQKAVALQAKLTGREADNSAFIPGMLGRLYDQMGRSAEALPLLEREVKREEERWGPNTSTVLERQRDVAIAERHLGRMADAVALFETILRRRAETSGDGHPETIQSLRDVAEAYEATGRADAAMPLYERLVAAVEALRARGDLSSENRQALFAQWVEAYKRLARLRIGHGDAAGAFQLAELSKARTLLESTAFRRAAQSAELSAAEQQRLQGYEHQLADLGDRIAVTDDAAQKLILETRKDALVRELTQFRAQLAAAHPKYAKLSDVTIVDAEAGRRLLPDDAVLVSYLLAGDTPLAFTLTRKDGLEAHALTDTPGLAQAVVEYREALLSPDAWQSADTPAARLGRGLSERLLAPLAGELRGKRHWIISPDGALAALPFEALALDGKPAIGAHDLSYVQSLSMLALLQQRDADYRSIEGRKTLLAMGGAEYETPGNPTADKTAPANRGAAASPALDIGAYVRRNAADARVIRRAYDLLDVRWPALPGSAREVDAVAAVFAGQPVATYKQHDASEATLLALNTDHALASYRYLLFSTHGYLSTEEPALSAIVLSQRDLAPGTDGYVTASKWPAYELRSDLIVLSACETGLGKVVQGEGVMGLPYALYVAGNRNTLLSLWSVVDESTAAFMMRLFAQLAAGKSQVQAINDTKREFIAGGKYAAPVFWAPFVLYGS
ncbi:MAG TPA: CHAT domain-containing tetratricopeptide repeat protein, partial [Candidatus Sulfotelmatobacter sp.]|nr:CHAT domain-containing tetratricopeptide repeat protein [Candidatus Sulfotelmatobacter sp.]